MQAVDVTARPYNIGLMPFGGRPRTNAAQTDHIYLTMLADGGDVYFAFGSATNSTLDNTANNAVGVAVTATTMSGVATWAQKIPSGQSMQVRIERSTDTWIVLKTSAGTSTLRVHASSQPEV